MKLKSNPFSTAIPSTMLVLPKSCKLMQNSILNVVCW